MKGIVLGLLVVLGSTVSFAQESIVDIAQQKEFKAAMIAAMQVRIQRHSQMTREEILQDYADTVARLPHVLGIRGTVDLSELASMDKEDILAMEEAQLRQTMVSGNFVFGFTRMLIRNIDDADVERNPFIIIPLAVGFVLCVAGDVALFAPQLVLSALTGF